MFDLTVKPVDVLGDTVMAAKDNDGVIWVGVKWMCKGMGMTEGQWKRQIINIQKDLLLSKAGSNLILPIDNNGEKEVFCLKNDYLPIWLAKISITPSIQKHTPELAEKLLNYQLKAKDILAAAFMPKQENAGDVQGQIKLLAQGTTELYQRVDAVDSKVDGVKAEIEALRDELPLFPSEADKIKNAVNKRVVEILGGKESNAYKDKSLSKKVFINCYQTLKGNFEEIGKYTEIKRKYRHEALKIVEKYEPPFFLAEQIEAANAQQQFNV